MGWKIITWYVKIKHNMNNYIQIASRKKSYDFNNNKKIQWFAYNENLKD